jgi:anti-anti-sigma factor
MEIQKTQHENVTIITLVGDLDAMTANEALQGINSALESGFSNLVIDLDQVEFLSSAGMRTLLSSLQGARQKGGDLRLAGGSNNIRRTLDFSGFTKIMKSYATTAEAVESYN